MRKSTDRFITIQNSSPTSLTEKSFHQQVAIRRMPEFDRAKAQRKLVQMRGSRSTMVIQRDFSLNPARYSVSSAVDSSSVAVETDTIDFLLKRMGTQKYRRRGKDANLCELLDDVLVSSSWRGCWTDRKKRKMRERERESHSQLEKTDAGPCRLALIRWLGGNDKERKIIGLSVAALFNPLPPRGELFLSAAGPGFWEGW